MRMGNFLGVQRHGLPEMATSHREVGIAHVTVVPTNAGPAESTPAEDDDSETDADADN